jgi:hypothetical protein
MVYGWSDCEVNDKPVQRRDASHTPVHNFSSTFSADNQSAGSSDRESIPQTHFNPQAASLGEDGIPITIKSVPQELLTDER